VGSTPTSSAIPTFTSSYREPHKGLFDIKDNGVALYAAIKDKVPAKYGKNKGQH